ncbi:MAG: hypothetical protein R2746_02200 [Acidimicrobiales bacterium]
MPFSLLLVDEPFVPGPARQDRAARAARRGAARRAATIVATHDPAYVDRVDRSIALRDGEVVFDGQWHRSTRCWAWWAADPPPATSRRRRSMRWPSSRWAWRRKVAMSWRAYRPG